MSKGIKKDFRNHNVLDIPGSLTQGTYDVFNAETDELLYTVSFSCTRSGKITRKRTDEGKLSRGRMSYQERDLIRTSAGLEPLGQNAKRPPSPQDQLETELRKAEDALVEAGEVQTLSAEDLSELPTVL